MAVRPPGHHAEHNRPMGFCLYNNVMVGVAHAQKVHGVGKIAILDFDVHHGNGDADITASDPTLLYASSAINHHAIQGRVQHQGVKGRIIM